MNLQILPACFSIVALLTACQNLETTNYTKLNDYLNHFIGQSSQAIQTQINFKSLGYQVQNEAEITPTALTYTILRPVPIPALSSNPTIGVSAVGVPVIRNDPSPPSTYNVNFYCKITFNLENNIAKSIDYYGKAC